MDLPSTGRRRQQASKKLYFPPSPKDDFDELTSSKLAKKQATTSNSSVKGKQGISPVRRESVTRLNGRASFASWKSISPKQLWPLKAGNDTIILDSSSEIEVIDASIQEMDSEFAWIKTPRSIKSLVKPSRSGKDSQAAVGEIALRGCPKLLNEEAPKVHKWISAACIRAVVEGESPIQNLLGADRRTSYTRNETHGERSLRKMTGSTTTRRRSSAPALSPTIELLNGSRRRNVEEWLAVTATQPVTTPPMSLSPHRRRVPRGDSSSDIDPEVRDVLIAVYGENWEEKACKKSKTEVKKARPKLPIIVMTEGKVRGGNTPGNDLLSGSRNVKTRELGSKVARRKIFDDKLLRGAKNHDTNDLGAQLLDFGSTQGAPMHITETASGKKPTRRKRKRSVSNGDTNRENILQPLEKIDSGKPVVSTPNTRSSAAKINGGNSAMKTPRRTFLASLSVSTPSTVCHPDARMYKINFATKKDELVSRLFKLYNSEVFSNQLPTDMSIKWNPKMRGTAGFCYSKRKKLRTGIVRLARVELAPRVVDRADRLRDTLVHELCHAAAWIVDGVRDGHGAVWQAWANRAMARFPELPPIRRCHNYQIATKFTYRCTVCGYSINRQSRSIDIERKRCGHCLGKLELLFNKKKRGVTEVPEFETTRTIRAPNKFALFVKENYRRVKETHPGEKYGDLMKLLSQQYAVFKSVVTPVKA